MGPHHRPEDRLLEGRELPPELTERFDSWDISRQERDTFRDRLWATCPTTAELEAVSIAKNPWAELGKLEERPLPPLVARHQQPPKTNPHGEDLVKAPAPAKGAATDSPLTQATLPQPPSSNPYAEHLRHMGDEDLFEFHTTFTKLYHLDSPYAVPEAMLQDSKLLIYQALTAEVRYRKGGE